MPRPSVMMVSAGAFAIDKRFVLDLPLKDGAPMMTRSLILFSLSWITTALLFFPSIYAGERVGCLKRDSIYQKKINILDKSGIRKGYLKRDALKKDRVIIYDRYGRRKGHLEGDPMSGDRATIYDRMGRRVGSVKRDALRGDRLIIRDKVGIRAGNIDQDRLDKNRIDSFSTGGGAVLPLQ